MKGKFVLWFEEISKKDINIVGGKCASLGELNSRADVPTLPGFAITADAYNYFLDHAKLRDFIKKSLEELDTHNLRDLARRGSVPAVLEVLDEILTAMCLLNRRWVTHDYYKGLEDSFEFEKLPVNYVNLVPALYHARQPQEIVDLADKLVAGFWHLIAEEDIPMKDYQTVDEIPV